MPNAPSPICATRELGRATFLPLDTLASRDGHALRGLAGRAGVIGYAHTLVRTAARYEGIVAFLVGRILIVDALPTGIGLVRGEGFRDSIVTLDGEQILGGGAITGGRYAPRALDPRPARASAFAARTHPRTARRTRTHRTRRQRRAQRHERQRDRT